MLGSILVLRGGSGTALQGSLLLLAYSIGLAVPFFLAGALLTRAMGVFRWLRDHYYAMQIASGTVHVALGGLLFTGRFFVLRVYINRGRWRLSWRRVLLRSARALR